jgi:hypothetical protein
LYKQVNNSPLQAIMFVFRRTTPSVFSAEATEEQLLPPVTGVTTSDRCELLAGSSARSWIGPCAALAAFTCWLLFEDMVRGICFWNSKGMKSSQENAGSMIAIKK